MKMSILVTISSYGANFSSNGLNIPIQTALLSELKH